ncbi:hypothetical protein BG842_05350 [Haladaptatus sp. W1]|nr:hypothetical protein BG842_05350 [Haladaptatus sp. W1]
MDVGFTMNGLVTINSRVIISVLEPKCRIVVRKRYVLQLLILTETLILLASFSQPVEHRFGISSLQMVELRTNVAHSW